QAMTPFAYVQALERVRAAIAEAAVTVDIIDVGGGFPSSYPGMEPPPLEDYFALIHRHFEALPISYSAELWAEPGRALCAEYSSMIVKVEQRRGDELYINAGAYGALFDAAHVAWRFPVRALEDDLTQGDEEFSFYGPTCDDADYMKGPFMLPADIQAGDWLEIGMLGAYGAAMKTRFNGFGTAEAVIVADEPMASLYTGERADPRQSENVVSLRGAARPAPRGRSSDDRFQQPDRPGHRVYLRLCSHWQAQLAGYMADVGPAERWDAERGEVLLQHVGESEAARPRCVAGAARALAEHHAGDLTQNAGERELRQHPVDAVYGFAGVFEEQDRAVE